MNELQGKDFDELSATRPEMIRDAHSSKPNLAETAREAFIEKYRPAVFRYALNLAKGDLDFAQEIVQDFAHAFVEGRFAVEVGGPTRFRYYLKTSVKHLFLDRVKKLQTHARRNMSLDEMVAAGGEVAIESLNPSGEEAVELPADEELDRKIREALAPAILRQTWLALEEWSATQKPDATYAGLTVFKFFKAISACEREAHEAGKVLKGEETCNAVNQALGLVPPMNYAAYRQRKSRGSLEFARLLLNEVRASFGQPNPDPELIEEECIALGFRGYVDRAWPKWKDEYERV